MGTLAKEFKQENLVPVTKAKYKAIRRAVERNMLLDMTRGHYAAGDKYAWIMKTEPSPDGIYLLVEHYEPKPAGGLAVVYKADKALLEAFEALSIK
ncbi:hypothetical protein [Shewanella algae]|uniref:hypothetical protein n=1 Tax=Shewanella TaxID=22 RepID=UPI0031F4DBD4